MATNLFDTSYVCKRFDRGQWESGGTTIIKVVLPIKQFCT